MKIQLTVTLPVAREDGTDAGPADVNSVTLASKLSAAPEDAWSILGPDVTNPEAVFTFDVNNVAPGAWDYRATFHDAQGGPDLAVQTSITVGVSPLVGGSITAAPGAALVGGSVVAAPIP